MEFSYGPQEFLERPCSLPEWLLTNGLGGFASSTITGLNTRRYHGLLIAALAPPGDRRLLLAKCDEDLYLGGEKHVLGTNQVPGGYAQEGYRHLQRFAQDPFPTYTYRAQDVFLVKRIFMVPGRNATVIRYSLINKNARKATVCIFPLVNCRDYHHTVRENDWPFFQELLGQSRVVVTAYPGAPPLFLASDECAYERLGTWYRNMYYAVEEARGLPCLEDHYIPGFFKLTTSSSAEFTITAAAGELLPPEGDVLEEEARRHRAFLLARAGYKDAFLRQLVLAAADFVVLRRATGKKTIVAGYPWFLDWGRDALISLPGLLLCTGRTAEAKEVLLTFAAYEKDGLLPNNFPDAGEEPWYHAVDAPLWFFYAVQKFLEYTGDYAFVREELYPVLKRIVSHYRKGTRFGIGMDADGLVTAGHPGLQLTWMDAKVGNWVVTPREGKPVEVNALWYNALRLMEQLAVAFGDHSDGKDYRDLAARARESFRKCFWNPEESCLYDVIGKEGKDAAVRPNQILAVSLPHSPLTRDKARLVVRRVWEELYTPCGLRSLSPRHPCYRGRYEGDQVARDSAYHQGTAWSWLLGHFVTAFLKAYGRTPGNLRLARMFLEPFREHLRAHGIGSISEIFDGDAPFHPRGCFAQAWGVAEILRAAVEDLGLR